jgi:hypothetical protein
MAGRYADRQKEAQSIYPLDEASTRMNVIIQAWENKPPGEDLYFVFAEYKSATQELQFAYPIGVRAGRNVSERELVDYAQRQHEHFKRPAPTAPITVLRVTQELIAELQEHYKTGHDQGYCDFCGIKTDARKIYDAKNFVMATGEMSIGGWASCPECSALVDAEDREGLVRRMVEVSGVEKMPDVDVKLCRKMYEQNVTGFFAKRVH